jgi:hypothetical protein
LSGIFYVEFFGDRVSGTVRNIFKILCHEKDDTTQKSIGRQNLLLQKGVHPTKSLGSKHAGWEVQ